MKIIHLDDTIGAINPMRYKGYYYDSETKYYWLNSRFYVPSWRRFLSPDSINYLDSKNIKKVNLYAYCGNDSVNLYDPNGNSFVTFLFATFIVFLVAATINDVYQIVSGNVHVNSENSNFENVQVSNSYKLLTPWMRYGYSIYLNYFNPDTKDVIKGSSIGVQFEWELHNYAAWLGIGGDSAKDLDVGTTIFQILRFILYLMKIKN